MTHYALVTTAGTNKLEILHISAFDAKSNVCINVGMCLPPAESRACVRARGGRESRRSNFGGAYRFDVSVVGFRFLVDSCVWWLSNWIWMVRDVNQRFGGGVSILSVVGWGVLWGILCLGLWRFVLIECDLDIVCLVFSIYNRDFIYLFIYCRVLGMSDLQQFSFTGK